MENAFGREAFAAGSPEKPADFSAADWLWLEEQGRDIAARRERLMAARARLEAEEAALARQEAALQAKLSQAADKRAFSKEEKEWFERGEDAVMMEMQDRWQEFGSLDGGDEDGISAADKVRFIDARLREMPQDGSAAQDRTKLELLRSQYAGD